MQLTIDLPNLWASEKKTAELINRCRQFFFREMVDLKLKQHYPQNLIHGICLILKNHHFEQAGFTILLKPM
jgi:hypothetical protein